MLRSWIPPRRRFRSRPVNKGLLDPTTYLFYGQALGNPETCDGGAGTSVIVAAPTHTSATIDMAMSDVNDTSIAK